MSLPISTIISLASSFIENKTGNPIKRAAVGTIKAPVTAPTAVVETIQEKPAQSVTIAGLGAIASSYMQSEQDINIYEYVTDWLEILTNFAIDMWG